MCGGAKYIEPNGKEWKVYFPSPKAALPVLTLNGEVKWFVWGKRKEEAARDFIQGGWARIDSIRAGKWAKYSPRPVRLAVQAFMEKDEERVSHWIDVPENQSIQGLLATIAEDTRLYVVTEDTPPEFAWVHDRWPRLMSKTPSSQEQPQAHQL